MKKLHTKKLRVTSYDKLPRPSGTPSNFEGDLLSSLRPFALSCLLLFSLLPAFAQKPNQKIENQTKVFTKNYAVHAKDILELNTNYTTVTFQEWDKNEMDFTATVKLRNGTEKDMERVINGLSLVHRQSGKRISYTVSFTYSNDKKFCNDINELEISLLVKIPKDIFIELTTRYGNVEIENVHNDFNANIAYGNLMADNLFGNNNNINIKYGNLNVENLSGNKNIINLRYGKFTIRQANHLSLTIDYSKGELKESGTLKLYSRYCTIKMNTINNLELSSAYDKISIDRNIDKISGNMRYGTLTINTLKTSCVFTSFAYSKITVDEVLTSFTNISFEASYSHIKLNIPQDQSFALNYSGRYTDFKEKNIRLNDATFEASSNSVKMSGTYGKNFDTGKKVTIDAKYGSVSLFGQ
jgi:hypothetical protein